MEEKDLYREKYAAKFKELKAQIDALEARAEQVKAESKLELKRQIDDLRQKRDVLGQKLEDLKHSSEAAWKELRAGLEAATDNLKGALAKAKDQFK
jgi:chromosome segregation ATPase